MKSTLEWAQFYIAKGFSVIPLKCRDKKPAIAWKGFQERYATDQELKKWFYNGANNNIGIVTGQISKLVVIDFDDMNAFKKLGENVLKPTPTVVTNRGRHLYYRHEKILSNFQNHDDLPGVDLRGEGGYVVAPPSTHSSGNVYIWMDSASLDDRSLAELPEFFCNPNQVNKVPITELYQGASEGERNNSLARLAGSWARDGLSYEDCLKNALVWNTLNKSPLLGPEIKRTIESIFNREQSKRFRQRVKTNANWPESLGRDAYHGLIGTFLNKVAPHTEADLAAILIQFLTAFGNIIGNKPYFKVEADRHSLRLFTVIVGNTSKARKGTSLSIVTSLFSLVDKDWVADRISTGLSSGEGLIWHVRDEDGERCTDKRLLIKESEFGAVLKVLKRDGNTLSAILRQAWDGNNLSTLTKNSPTKATCAHISIIGHITRDELNKYLSQTEIFSGFANRFIWICARRSKSLPEGGNFHKLDWTDTSKQIQEAIKFSRTIGEIEVHPEAKELWIDIYHELSAEISGLAGTVLSRSEAQVMRLAAIYALLDQSSLIRKVHLLAALAVWDYAERSVMYIFGTNTGDKIADRILGKLSQTNEGLSKTDISDLFSRHASEEKIDRALNLLMQQGQVRMVPEKTGGRPSKKYYYKGEESENFFE